MNYLPEAVATAIEQMQSTTDGAFFVYDLDGFEQHVKQLVKSDLTLWYAVKANPLSAVIKVLAKHGFGFDVASIGELEQVLAQGISADRILNTGPAKSYQQLAYFLDRGVQTYVVESIQQLNDLQVLAANYNFTPQVLLRVQLSWDEAEQGSNPLGGCNLTPFGLTPQDWLSVNTKTYDELNIKGLHIFQWGNILSAERLGELWSAMSGPLNALADKLEIDYKVLDLGGGLGIPYEDGENTLNWQDVDAVLAQVKEQVSAQELWMELGRFAIGTFGYYVCPVVERKSNNGQNQLIMGGGINHLLRPAISGQAFPASLLRSSESEAQPFAVYGPLCTGLDKLGEFELPGDLVNGDHLVFSQCGAYGFTESMPFFLCHALPAEAVIYQQKLEVLREPQAASAWLR
jgi:diaminopimelate decarboxylase